MDATSGAGTANHSRAPFSPVFFFVGLVLLNYDVHCLSFFLSHCIVWFFHLQLMIAPSVSSNFSNEEEALGSY